MSAPVIDGVLWKRAPHSAVTLHQQRTCKLENAVLSYMSGKGSPKTVELLLEKGADATLVDHHKRTAQQLAEARNFPKIAELISYCAEQARINKQSFGDVIQRAAFIRTAVGNFKASLGTVSFAAETKMVPLAHARPRPRLEPWAVGYGPWAVAGRGRQSASALPLSSFTAL